MNFTTIPSGMPAGKPYFNIRTITTDRLTILYEKKHMIADAETLDIFFAGHWMYLWSREAYIIVKSSKTGIEYTWYLTNIREFLDWPIVSTALPPQENNRVELTFRLFPTPGSSYYDLRESQRDWKIYIYSDLTQDYYDLKKRVTGK